MSYLFKTGKLKWVMIKDLFMGLFLYFIMYKSFYHTIFGHGKILFIYFSFILLYTSSIILNI